MSAEDLLFGKEEDEAPEVETSQPETDPEESAADPQEATTTPEEGSDGAAPAPEKMVPYKALAAERKKRRALQEENAFLKGRASNPPSAPAPAARPELEEPDFYTDPQKYIDFKAERIAEEKAAKKANELLQAYTQRQWEKVHSRSVAKARKTYGDDLEQIWTDFAGMAKENQALAAEFYDSDDPLEYAVQTVKRAQRLASLGDDFDIDAEVEKRVAAKMKELEKGPPLPKKGLPRTNADVRSTRAAPPPDDDTAGLLDGMFPLDRSA